MSTRESEKICEKEDQVKRPKKHDCYQREFCKVFHHLCFFDGAKVSQISDLEKNVGYHFRYNDKGILDC